MKTSKLQRKFVNPIDAMRSRVECDHEGEAHVPNGNMVKCAACGCTWYAGETPVPYATVKIGS